MVASGEGDGSVVIPPDSPCFPLAGCRPDDASLKATSDDTGVGALLVNTDLSGADLTGADLNGVVMVSGSLREARLGEANTNGARWLGVGFQRTLCPDGSLRSAPCPGFQAPHGGPDQAQALARVAWLRALPWPWD